ncbi:amino acid aminotransferase [Stutzerimonas degradans]|uniref:Aromatic amino acid aminotransferase n=1 Tax=Stutzerimonas degradans TaxID=2968968 RepID=A0A8E2U647_9GAMM|nr:amino acid aminotransferase [Stutzerimonas degradans]MCQ4274922.1 aspartate/tyrosine/aromatic aminotransferase [Stutzerimonas degradans]PNF78359.1 aromatic amino acid aminotransferase [Stutzerimonas degradans]QPT20218.1 aspartate/tyrosine/aromatic aminotransferase [Stutzerimonas degradans]
MHFGQIPRVPGDPILGLLDAFRADANPAKLDLGVGVYKDAHGQTPIPRAVKLAEQRLVDSEKTKSYIGGHGDAQFGALLMRLVLSPRAVALAEDRAGCTQAPGGTGALRLAGEFIARCLPGRTLWLSDPTWPIHQTLFAAAGVPLQHYPYVGADNRLDRDGLFAALERIPAGDVVLLHACCHNPSGFDLSHDDWLRVLEIVRSRELLPLFDFAYQGFGEGLEEDAWAVRLFAETLPEVLITSSCSKNFGLYRERTGALIVIAAGHEQLLDVRSQLAALARGLWSTPPAHGAAVVTTILADDALRQIWQDEVEGMRQRIASLRQGLVEALTPYGLAERFAHIAEQRGMFSYTGLTAAQVRRLRAEHSVYLVESGRASVAGLDAERLDELARAFASVVD